MSIKLQVPFVSQLNYGHNNQQDDPTGCWYASACMVAYFYEQGPRLGVPELHSASISKAMRKYLGVKKGYGHVATGSWEAQQIFAGADNEHEKLATRENLVAVPQCATAYAYTLADLEERLRDHGPIFFYWKKPDPQGYGHASVIFGTDDKTNSILYHDPESAPNSSMSVSRFHTVRQKWKYALMQRRGLAPKRAVTSSIANRAKLWGGV